MTIKRIPCVAAILLNAAQQVLLIQRDDKPGLEFAGYWTLPGGLVEADETPAAAIVRELEEEIGLVTSELTPWHVYDRPHHRLINGNTIIVEQHVYSSLLDVSAAEITLGEGQAVRFFAAGELTALHIAYGFDTLLSEFLTAL